MTSVSPRLRQGFFDTASVGIAMPTEDRANDEAKKWYERKSAMMETWLGKEHDRVMHAIIPFQIGGALDLYYYPNGLFGTAIATKELSIPRMMAPPTTCIVPTNW